MTKSKRQIQKQIASKIDAITEQENKLNLAQNTIHRRLMILKQRKARLVTQFILSEQLKQI